MSFKNAVKILCSKFSIVWAMLVAMLLAAIIVVSLSVQPVRNIYAWLSEQGFVDRFLQIFNAFISDWNVFALINSVIDLIKSILAISQSAEILWNFTLQMGFLIFILLKFICSTFDLAVTKVLQSYMSDNRKSRFLHAYVESIFKSMLYALVKTFVFFCYDLICVVIVYYTLVLVEGIPFIIPFVFFAEIILFMGLRSSVFFAWTPYMAVEGYGVFRALGASVVLCFTNFGKVFSGYIVTWIIILALSVFMIMFTFGVAAIICVPLFAIFLSVLNMTYFYGKNGMRYYLDGKIFDLDAVMQ